MSLFVEWIVFSIERFALFPHSVRIYPFLKWFYPQLALLAIYESILYSSLINFFATNEFWASQRWLPYSFYTIFSENFLFYNPKLTAILFAFFAFHTYLNRNLHSWYTSIRIQFISHNVSYTRFIYTNSHVVNTKWFMIDPICIIQFIWLLV